MYTSNFHKTGQLYQRLTPAERYHRDNVQFILESFHYIHRDRYVENLRQDGQKVFLDSGAFSAWTKEAKIDIKKYCSYIKKNDDILLHEDGQPLASVLDAIGDAYGTYVNQKAMEQLGVKPLPCFHYGEDERYLEWYIANYPYITLGGMVAVSTQQLYPWLDRLFEKYLTDGSGRPKLKVHGFGLTTLELMQRYPWWSVDSSSWVQIAANGTLLLPTPNGLWKYVPISDVHPTAKMANVHYNTVPPIQQEALRNQILSAGFEVERLKKEYISRWCFNCWAYTEINRRISTTDKRFKADQISLF